MKEEIKEMSVKEFREKGFLQEANRLFFHPIGLALSVNLEEDDSESFGIIWDCTDDPEGAFFGDSMIKEEYIKYVESLRKSKIKNRFNADVMVKHNITVGSTGVQLKNEGWHTPTMEISIERYKELLENEKFLRALEGAGVDNWDGYDIAIEYMEENS